MLRGRSRKPQFIYLHENGNFVFSFYRSEEKKERKKKERKKIGCVKTVVCSPPHLQHAELLRAVEGLANGRDTHFAPTGKERGAMGGEQSKHTASAARCWERAEPLTSRNPHSHQPAPKCDAQCPEPSDRTTRTPQPSGGRSWGSSVVGVFRGEGRGGMNGFNRKDKCCIS